MHATYGTHHHSNKHTPRNPKAQSATPNSYSQYKELYADTSRAAYEAPHLTYSKSTQTSSQSTCYSVKSNSERPHAYVPSHIHTSPPRHHQNIPPTRKQTPIPTTLSILSHRPQTKRHRNNQPHKTPPHVHPSLNYDDPK